MGAEEAIIEPNATHMDVVEREGNMGTGKGSFFLSVTAVQNKLSWICVADRH